MRILVTDLDGTLLNNGKISNQTVKYLNEFQKKIK